MTLRRMSENQKNTDQRPRGSSWCHPVRRGLSVIPFSSMVERLNEEMQRAEREAMVLSAMIENPALAVSNPE